MTYVTLFGAILCGWTLLNLLSGERQRRVDQLKAEHDAAQQRGG